MKNNFIAFVLSVLIIQLASADERQECRKKMSTGSVSEIANCIERGVYDPCDDAGGSVGKSMCAWAHVEVAERKISKAEREILSKLIQVKADENVKSMFLSSQKTWRNFRDQYCEFTNKISDYESTFRGTSDLYGGFCSRRLTEQRAKELEFILHR